MQGERTFYLSSHETQMTIGIFLGMLLLVVGLGSYGNTWNTVVHPIWYLDLRPNTKTVYEPDGCLLFNQVV